jgi:NADH dehydrogenase
LERKNDLGKRIEAFPFNFEKPEKLTESLQGVAVLYNTYWVRFNHQMFNHETAVRNTIMLFDSAKKAGVERIVHVSITNPSERSHLEYFSGKARIEKALINSGVSYSILRPTVLFGKEDILINNIAWILRKFPFFLLFGDGNYRLQPIYVDDLAMLAVREGNSRESVIINAVGPETFAFKYLVETISRIIGKRRRIIPVPPYLGYIAGSILSKIVNDVIITREEIDGLMAGLLHVESQPTGKTKLTEWIKKHADSLGRHYASELGRRRDRVNEYKAGTISPKNNKYEMLSGRLARLFS